MVDFMQGNYGQPPFVYPATVLTFRNPEIFGKSAINAPQSITSVECLNFASVKGTPLQGEVKTISDLFSSLELGQGKIGRFEGESREMLGDFDDITDFDGMVETLLGINGTNGSRDDSLPPPFFTYVGWLKHFKDS